MPSPKTESSPSLWRAAIWLLVVSTCGMTGLLIDRLSSPVTRQDADLLNLGLSYAVPSQWEELQRITSPAGDLDLVIANIDTVSEIKRDFDDGSTVTAPASLASFPETSPPPTTWTCVLVVPKGAPLPRAAPYPLHRRRILTARLDETLVLSCSPLIPVQVSWKLGREVVVETPEQLDGPQMFRARTDGAWETVRPATARRNPNLKAKEHVANVLTHGSACIIIAELCPPLEGQVLYLEHRKW